MAAENWVSAGDNLEHFDDSYLWPDQKATIDGKEVTVPAKENYHFGNRSLPMAYQRDRFVESVTENPITILIGPTGSGKTTGGVQALYESGMGRVIQAQPRIALARNICYRVRQEMAYANREPQSADELVGYTTSTESELSKTNEIIQATYGKVLRWVMYGVPEMRESIFMADEFHLRNMDSDMLIAKCAALGLKTVISSATIDAEKIAQKYASRDGTPAPIIELEGRVHPTTYVKGEKLIDDITRHATQDLMVFLPGRREIDRAMSQSAVKKKVQTNSLALHGEQTKQEQQKVFDQSHGLRAIFSTSVGEMGITPNVDVVIDPGWERITYLDGNGVATLGIAPASHATRAQRGGRTGRTAPGIVIYGSKMDDYPALPPDNQLPEYDTPEILRTRLDSLSLCAAVAGDTFDTLPLPDQPSPQEVNRALVRLRRIGALDDDNAPTEIGQRMARLPLDPSYARMLIESERYEQDLPSIRAQLAALAAVQQVQGIISTGSTKDAWRTVVENDGSSDLIFGMDLFTWAIDSERTPSDHRENGIVEPKFQRAKDFFMTICEKEGIDPSALALSGDTQEEEALLACIIAGADELFVRSGKECYKDVRGETRRLQKISTSNYGKLAVGSPWNLQSMRSENLTTQRLIRSPTVVTRRMLTQYAPHRCTYARGGYDMDGWGNVRAKKALYFDGQYVDDIGRESAKPEPSLRDFLVETLFTKTAENIRELPPNVRSFCKQVAELRYLEHKTNDDLHVQFKLNELQQQICDQIPDDVSSFIELDRHIDFMWVMNAVEPNALERILKTSPDVVSVSMGEDIVEIPVEYHKNEARLRFSKDQLDHLPAVFPELKGHEVKIKIGTGSRLHTIDDALARALYPNRAHWRGNSVVDHIEYVPQKRERQDGYWDGSTVTVRNDTSVQKPPKVWTRRRK